jgi:hypothetical protein
MNLPDPAWQPAALIAGVDALVLVSSEDWRNTQRRAKVGQASHFDWTT